MTSITGFHVAAFVLTFLAHSFVNVARKSSKDAKEQLIETWTTERENRTLEPKDLWSGHVLEGDKKQAAKLFLLIDGAYMLSYGAGLYFAGYLGDRLELRALKSIGLFLAAIALFCFGPVTEWAEFYNKAYYICMMVAAGLASSTSLVTSIAVMGNWFPAKNRGTIMGFWSSCVPMGVLLFGFMSKMALETGYHNVYLMASVFLIFGGFVIAFGLVTYPAYVGLPQADDFPCPEDCPTPSSGSDSKQTAASTPSAAEPSSGDGPAGPEVEAPAKEHTVEASGPPQPPDNNEGGNDGGDERKGYKAIEEGEGYSRTRKRMNHHHEDGSTTGRHGYCYLDDHDSGFEMSPIISPTMSPASSTFTVYGSAERPYKDNLAGAEGDEEELIDEEENACKRCCRHFCRRIGRLFRHRHAHGDQAAEGEKEGKPACRPVGFFEAMCLPGVVPFALSYAFLRLVDNMLVFWLPVYLEKHFKWKKDDADNAVDWYDGGGIIGSVLAGMISDYLFLRSSITLVMLVLGIPSLLIYRFIPGTIQWLNKLLVLNLGIWLSGASGLVGNIVVVDLGRGGKVPKHVNALATVTGIVDGTASLAAAVGQMVLPFVEDTMGYTNSWYFFMAATGLAVLVVLPTVVSEIKEWLNYFK